MLLLRSLCNFILLYKHPSHVLDMYKEICFDTPSRWASERFKFYHCPYICTSHVWFTLNTLSSPYASKRKGKPNLISDFFVLELCPLLLCYYLNLFVSLFWNMVSINVLLISKMSKRGFWVLKCNCWWLQDWMYCQNCKIITF